jgi:hypothetical protein
MDDVPDLHGTIFNETDLNWARTFLLNSIGFLDEDWLREPVGPLGGMWAVTRGDQPMSFLINLAHTMRDINQATERKSVPVLHRKLRAILRPASEKSFEDDLTELEFGAALAPHASPILIEPLATYDSENRGNQRRSPDYAIVLPDGFAYFEVTRPTFEFINSWYTGAAEADKAMQVRLWRRGLRRTIHFQAPITASRSDLKLLHTREVLDAIEHDVQGSRRIQLDVGEAEVKWWPIAEHSIDAGPGNFPAPFSILSHSIFPGPALAMSYGPTYDVDLEDLVVSSIRGSLNRKKGQMPKGAPYLIVVRIEQLNKDAIAQVLFRRILANPVYSWITGIVLFQPMRKWTKSSPVAQIELLANERARVPLTPALRSLLRGRKQFHMRPRELQDRSEASSTEEE